MKTLTKVGLSALAGALAVTSANAGTMALSGSMQASYTKGSGYTQLVPSWYEQRIICYWFW